MVYTANQQTLLHKKIYPTAMGMSSLKSNNNAQ